MAVAVGQIYRWVIWNKAGGQYGLNVRYFEIAAQVGAGLLEQPFVNAIHNAVKGQYAAIMSAAAECSGSSIQLMGVSPKPLPWYSNTAAAVGVNAGDILPKQTAGIISIGSAYAGRGNRGRVYLAFPPEGMSDAAGKPSAGYIAAATILAANFAGQPFFQDGVPNGWQVSMRIEHYNGGGVYATTYNVRDRWATQRRRGDYGAAYPGPY